jgi:Cof subfamily protein (haloacid dehalogenase superfamily)
MTIAPKAAALLQPPSGGAIRLAVLDIDGTLLDPSGAVTTRVREAVRAASACGCQVTLASGRRLWAVRPIVEDLGIDVPVILYNGAIVYDVAGDKPLVGAYLERSLLRNALDQIWSCGFQPVLYGHPRSGELVYTGPAGRDAPATIHYFDRPTVQPQRLDLIELYEVAEPPLLAAMGNEAEMRDLEQSIATLGLDCQTLVERQTFVPRSIWWQLDISASGCSKGSALRRLCEHYGIGMEETLAVGDGINDLPLIRAAGLGVAMGNAVPEVLAASTVVVADHAHGGAAEALERFVLSNGRTDVPCVARP